MSEILQCSVDGCTKAARRRGLCSAHHSRFLRHGSPTGGGTAWGEPRKFLERAFDYFGDECLIWPYGKDGAGYAEINDDGKPTLVHRLVCVAAHGVRPSPQHEVAHSCGRGNQGCISAQHLRWATGVENQADRVAHGTSNRGEGNPQSRLTISDIQEIRRLASEGVKPTEIAARFSVHRSHVDSIVRGAAWAKS
jgi:HNH endonuclease